jgi:hypothetical protein
MKTRTEPRRRHAAAPVTVRTAGWITAGLLVATAALGPAARSAAAASVDPTPINSGNPACSAFAPAGENWTQFKLEAGQLADGTYTDGTLTVTISNYHDSSSGTPGAFDWDADQGIDAVFVKAGTSKHNLYVYDPEATSDEGLAPQAGIGNGISHISFCYDSDGTNPPTETPSSTPSDEPSSEPNTSPSSDPSESPSSDPSDEPSSEPSTSPSTDPSTDPTDPPVSDPTDDPSSDPTDDPSSQPTDEPTSDPTNPPSNDVTHEPTSSPTSEVLGATSGPNVTPPPTDTVSAVASTGQVDAWRIVALGLAMVIVSLLLMPSRPARSRARR